MESSISKELKSVFDLASLRHETKMLRNPADIQRSNEIKARYKKLNELEENRYQKDYNHRVNKVTKKLIDAAGKKNRNFTHRWFGIDQFDKSAIQRQAHRIVQHEHHQRMSRNAKNEKSELKSLMTDVEEREHLSQDTKQEFERVTDRRSGQERRKNISQKPIHTRSR